MSPFLTTHFCSLPRTQVSQRIEQFTDVVGLDPVIVGTDCGIGTFADYGYVDPDIAYAKIAAMTEGAAIVR